MKCRVCNTPTTPWLSLGSQPLANGFYHPTDHEPQRYPLQVERCPYCALSQLTVVVPPEQLYRNYTYRSGLSMGFRKHCAEIGSLASTWAKESGRGTWLDVASNDGTLLNRISYYGFTPLGVEPATTLAAEANANKIPTICGFFPEATKDLPSGSVDVISSVNVLGHVQDVHAFAAEVNRLLSPKGSWIVEVPWVRQLLDAGAFDTIYHEHLSYWSLKALATLARANEMHLTFAEYQPITGGSLLVRIRKEGYDLTLWDESRLFGPTAYREFRDKMETRINRVRGQLGLYHGRWAAYGAAAKGTVFACAAGLNRNHLEFVVDETPEKQGLLTPYGVPIVPLTDDVFKGITNVLIFPWNVADEIKAKLPRHVRSVTTE